MINPSAHGWIDKYFSEQKEFFVSEDVALFYENIRKTGFIYGHIMSIDSETFVDISTFKSDEISKTALLNTLFSVYYFNQKEYNPSKFIEKTVEFYAFINPKGFSFLTKILSSTPSSKLENFLDERVQTNKDIISKNFSHILTNALLFVDVLAFEKFMITGAVPEKYLQKTEEIILSIIALALQLKTIKSQNDVLLIKLFEASVRYTKFSNFSKPSDLESLPLDYFKMDLEKYYLLDLAGMALWNDGIIENDEIYFLHKLGAKMGLTADFITKSIKTTSDFISKNKKDIQYFNYSNPVKHFYEQTTHGVEVLIKRNKKRLTKELTESKELVSLLAKSTQRDLSKEEKKKVKKQLLDICKSIPSLTIFLLPGGGLLLPILIKFIPQLLPSAFNENLED